MSSTKDIGASSASGYIKPFDGQSIRWETWERKLSLEIAALSLKADSKKKLLLLRSLSEQVFEQVINWCSPVNPEDSSFDELLTLLRSKFSSPSQKTSARFELLHFRQKSGQSFQEYMMDLTELFGKADLKSMKWQDFGMLFALRGVTNDELRQYLWDPERSLKSLENLTDLGIKFEASKACQREVKSSFDSKTPPPSINVVGKGYKPCRGCGKINTHKKNNCPAKNVECYNCERVGHFARFCPKKAKVNALKSRKGEEENESSYSSSEDETSKPTRNKVNGIKVKGYESAYSCSDSDSSPQKRDVVSKARKEPAFGLLTLSSSSDEVNIVPPIVAKVKINDKPIDLIYDTGSCITVVNKQIWSKLGGPKLSSFNGSILSFNKKKVHVLGRCFVKARVQDSQAYLPLVVVKEGECLLGRDWILPLLGPQILCPSGISKA